MRSRIAGILDTTGLGTLLRRFDAWHGTIVLAYHRIGDAAMSPLDRGVFSATEAEFEEQMAFLRRDFELVDPFDVGRAPHDRGRRVAVTFDDGYRDTWLHALPVLRRHAIPAAVFVTTGFVDDPHVTWWDEIAWMVRSTSRGALPESKLWPGPLPLGDHREAAIETLLSVYKRTSAFRGNEFLERLGAAAQTGRCPLSAGERWMTWAMVRELRDAGIRIGGHTVTHPVLARLNPAGQAREIAGCRLRLQDELGEPMRLFSYPVGLDDSFERVTRQLVADAGVELAFACAGGWLARFRIFDPLAIPRIPIGPDRSTRQLLAVTTMPRVFAAT